MLLFRETLTPRLSPWATPFTSSIYRFLSAPTLHETPSPTSQFAVQYLIESCGLPSDKAIRASRYISHIKFPDKPDAMLRFLRQAGITEPHIRAAACRQPQFLCLHVEKCKPRISELKEIGFSPSEISLLFSICPRVFSYTKLKQKVQFWMRIFGSVEKLLCALKAGYLLGVNLDNAVIPNITFLQEQCGLSACQISQLIKSSPRRIASKPEVFKMYVKRAKELGISPPSNTFVYALIVVGGLNQSTVDARLCHLKSLGLSHEEVTLLITKCPNVLEKTEKNIGQKMEFLLKQAGCGKIDVIKNPSLLTFSLEKRLIPRSLVRKLLKSRGIPAANNAFSSFMILNEKRFLEKYVLPYEETVLGLHQVYIDACAGKTAAT
ncbi:transcription termination factor MTERF15, mitochondrial-like isoform X2 [Carex rostrata]